MESPESLSTPSLATVFFDKFEKDELQELLSTKPHDWLFAQNIVDDKVSVLCCNNLYSNERVDPMLALQTQYCYTLL